MPAMIIAGLWSSDTIIFTGTNSTGTSETGFCVVPNTQNGPITITGGTIVFGTAAFTIPGGQFPVTLNPNQSVIIQVTMTQPADSLGRRDVLSLATNSPYSPSVQLTLIAGNPNLADFFPSDIQFPVTKVGQTSTFVNAVIVNTQTTNLTVSNIALTTGTSFFIIGAPATPFIMGPGTTTAPFSLQFTPIGTGAVTDTLTVTSTNGPEARVLYGVGSTLQSAFILTGGVQGTLFALSGATGMPLILLANPTNLSTEEPGSFVRLHDWQMPNYEKKLMRVRGHYEDLGPAVITFKAVSRRLGATADDIMQVNVHIGTVAADGWLREFTAEPVPLSGELIQLTCSRAANSGPVSLLDYTPEFEPAGEVIGGT
jgi:hypothetical protein